MKNKTFNIISLSILLFSSYLFAGAPDTLWTRTYGGDNMEIAYSVQQTSDGGFIIVGSTGSVTTGYKVYLIRANNNGDTLWTKTHREIGGYSVQQTSDDGFIITGNTLPSGSGISDVYLISTNSNGDTLWTNSFGRDSSDEGFSVQQTSDGGFIIAGYTKSFGAGGRDVYLIKTDSDGDTLWTKTYGGEYNEWGRSIKNTSDGGFIIAGGTASFGDTLFDVYLIRMHSNGDTLWTKTYGGDSSDGGNSVQQTSDGGFIIAGWTESFGAGQNDIYLIQTDSNGDTLWTRTYGGADNDIGTSVQQTNDGGFIIAGYTRSFGAGDYDVYLIRTNSNGDTLWTKTYGGDDRDIARSIQLTNDGGYIIAGDADSFGAGDYDVYLIRLDKDTTGIQDDNPNNFLNPNDFIVSYNNNNLISIRYSIQHSSSVNLSMYNISGQLVKTVFNEYKSAGDHTINFKTYNISAGVYYFKLTAGESSYTRKAVVVE